MLAAAAARPLVARPVAEVVDGSIVMREIASSSTMLVVTTDIDLACAVVFGEVFGPVEVPDAASAHVFAAGAPARGAPAVDGVTART